MLIFKALGGLVAFSAVGRSQTTDQDDFKSKCTSFRPNIPNAKFEFAELIQSGTAANLLYADRTCGGPQQSNPVAQDVCRVTMYLQTSAQSGVQFEAWLPKKWNGRFLATGNGGIGGCKLLISPLRHVANQ
jgi:feruloyl esterase